MELSSFITHLDFLRLQASQGLSFRLLALVEAVVEAFWFELGTVSAVLPLLRILLETVEETGAEFDAEVAFDDSAIVKEGELR